MIEPDEREIHEHQAEHGVEKIEADDPEVHELLLRGTGL